MFFNAVKATVLISAASLAVEGSTLEHKSANKRHYGGAPCKSLFACLGYSGNSENEGYGSVESDSYARTGSDHDWRAKPTPVHSGGQAQEVSGGVDVMVKGWASLTSGFKNLEITFSSGASVDVAVQAALSLGAQVKVVTTRYASCGCSASPESRIAFENMVTQFSSSMQLCLEAGQKHYGDQWKTKFQPIFQQYSLAFERLEVIAASLQVNLGFTLQRARVNVQLFSASGLYLSALFPSLGPSTGVVATSAGIQVPGGLGAMVQGWASLTLACNKLAANFSSGASADVAVQDASFLSAQVRLVSAQHASCGCSASSQARAAFEQMVTQFLASMQLCLQAGQKHYGLVWKTRFQPIFQQCSPAFKSLQVIAASLQVNLGLVLQRARVDAQLFAGVGLNLSTLLNVRLDIGGSFNF